MLLAAAQPSRLRPAWFTRSGFALRRSQAENSRTNSHQRRYISCSKRKVRPFGRAAYGAVTNSVTAFLLGDAYGMWINTASQKSNQPVREPQPRLREPTKLSRSNPNNNR